MKMRLLLSIIVVSIVTMGLPRVSPAAARLDYTKGMKSAKAAISSGDHSTAERVLAQLDKRYPGNPELLAMHGRVLLWMKRYDEAYQALNEAYKRDPAPALREEVESAVAARDLAAAAQLLADSKTAEGEELLNKVYRNGIGSYEAGILLARSTYERGAYQEASAILGELVVRYPKETDLRPRYVQSLVNTGREAQALEYVNSLPEQERDADLLAIRGRIQFRKGDEDGAVSSFAGSLALRPDMDVAAEREKADISRQLKKADYLLASGDNQAADEFLATLCDSQSTRYEGCRRRASLAVRTGNHGRAADIYSLLAASYPAEADFNLLRAQELLTLQKLDEAAAALDMYPDRNNATYIYLRGRIALYHKQYEEAISYFSRAVSISNDPEIPVLLKNALAANGLITANRLYSNKEYTTAELLLTDLYRNSADSYSAGILLGKTLFAEKKFRDAAALYQELEQKYPSEPDMTLLRVEAHLLAREYDEAAAVIDAATPAVQEYLAREREELLYQSTGNWFEVAGAIIQQNGRNSTTEKDLFFVASQRIWKNVLKGWIGTMSKYSQTDTQIGLELTGSREARPSFLYDVFFSISPEASIFPKTTAGIEITRSYHGYEASLGYTRMDFRQSNANIVIPGVLWYIPTTPLTLSERIYLVPETGGYSFLTTLDYTRDHRLKSFVSFGFGTSAERISTTMDYQKMPTVSARIGAEYRFTQHYSMEAESSFESRGDLYDRFGATLRLRYWWQ